MKRIGWRNPSNYCQPAMITHTQLEKHAVSGQKGLKIVFRRAPRISRFLGTNYQSKDKHLGNKSRGGYLCQNYPKRVNVGKMFRHYRI